MYVCAININVDLRARMFCIFNVIRNKYFKKINSFKSFRKYDLLKLRFEIKLFFYMNILLWL